MVKFYLISFFIFTSVLSFSQSAETANENNCLFGYISDNPKEFDEVIEFVEGLKLTVISNCDEEGLIYVHLNYKYKDYTDLFAQIERRFLGTCYYKSLENKIPRYDKCKDQYIKEIAEK